MERSELKFRYGRSRCSCTIVIVVSVCIILALCLITLGLGVYEISIPDAVGVFIGHLTGTPLDFKDDHYVFDVRLPRAIAAVFVGAALALGGAVMQTILRNPLADPYTMGISSGAFFGAVLSIICGFSIIPSLSGDAATIVNAFITSLIPVAVIVLLLRFNKMTPTVMILVGIAVMYVFASANQYLMVTADSSSLSEAYSWRVGTLADMTWGDLVPIVGVVTMLATAIMFLYRRVNVLMTDDDYCRTLGVNVQVTRVILLLLVALMTSTVVCFTGTIGFVGLVCPLVVRLFVGSDSRKLLPLSLVMGALFLLAIDSVAKITGVNGLPVGVISALIGGPVFVYLLVRRKGKNNWM